MKNFYLITIIGLLFCYSCSEDNGDSGNPGISDPAQIANIMNDNLVLPAGSFVVDPSTAQIDESITIGNGSSAVVPIASGQAMTNSISFNAPNGNVNAVGMRFGTTGPIYFVPINTNGATSGAGNFDFLINQGICADLSQVCHDIKCYEFAQTSAGNISRGNIRDVAMLCGNCDEPSCQGLVDPADCGGLQGQDGSPRFNLTWSGSADLDLYVRDPSGETLSFSNPQSSSGGALDVDCTGNCAGGNSENITWTNGGPSGTYQFYVNIYSGNSTSYTITVRDNGRTVNTYNGTINSGNSNTLSYTKS
ncbi:YfaP family protein [Aquimarina sp. SS2-1]|uniref:YfaP family protein n=1 Tax=Aquimarina besae TaxID=3342247 RepID=UPI0036727BCD